MRCALDTCGAGVRSPSMTVASFHLVRFPTVHAVHRMARVPADRRHLGAAAGAEFVKLLGTGSGQRMSRTADLRRWACFAIWADRDGLDAFLARDPISRAWDAEAAERFDAVLDPVSAHGTWDGVDPLAGSVPRSPEPTGPHPADGRPVAVLTRATVRARRLREFLSAVPGPERAMGSAAGLLAAVGIGEVPIGRQATFSLWRDAASVRAYAYDDPAHREVVRRTRTRGWYGEEWFARFRVVDASGTWDGSDPLAAAR